MSKPFKKFSILFVVVLILLTVMAVMFSNHDKNLGDTLNNKVSVIIPVYNVEEYLDDCLDSVENQTYRDLEIICVNDGSTDSSPEILEKHRSKDNRIKIINQENAGVSAARNTGMDAATGEWIYFIDSDDLIVPYTLEKAIESAKKYGAEIINFKYEDFSQHLRLDLSTREYRGLDKYLVEVKGKENPFKVFDMDKVNVWQNLYKRSFLTEHNIRFKKGVICEDVLFTWTCELYAKSMVKDKNVYYMYRYGRIGSIMNSDFKKVERRIDSFIAMIQDLVDMRMEFDFDGIDEQFIDMMLSLFYDSIVHDLNNAPEQKEYAVKALDIMENDYINVYRAKPNREQSAKINELRAIAKKG